MSNIEFEHSEGYITIIVKESYKSDLNDHRLEIVYRRDRRVVEPSGDITKDSPFGGDEPNDISSSFD